MSLRAQTAKTWVTIEKQQMMIRPRWNCPSPEGIANSPSSIARIAEN